MSSPHWAAARLLSARPAADEQVFLEVEPPAAFLSAHTRPGQFCQIRIGEDKGYFAMLSPPGAMPHFLVRIGNPAGGKAADALAALADGAAIEMTGPSGNGFGLERALGRDLRFIATGTGVAPVCAAIDHVLENRARYGAISLDHGLRTEAHLAIGGYLERWIGRGVEVRLAYSRVEDDGRLTGTTVQSSLRTACPDLGDAAVVAVGQSGMLESLREVVRECGGDPALLLTNI